MKLEKSEKAYQSLVNQISNAFLKGQKNAVAAVNAFLVETYWQIGKYIVEFEQDGKEKAEYGANLLPKLSVDLKLNCGKGFSVSNLIRMRQFYLTCPIYAELPHKLSWTHWVELLKIDDSLERSFYIQQTLLENWSSTELIRQKKSSLFFRLAASKDKDGILKLAREGQIIENPTDLIREPYVLEFLKIPEPHHLSETDLETALIDNLQNFLLELGKGFAFVGRQYRVTLDNVHYRIDLVFYHRILKCFVLIDLKKRKSRIRSRRADEYVSRLF